MKSKKGIFMAVVGWTCIYLSQANIFTMEIHPGLGIREDIAPITMSLLVSGIILLLFGTYKYVRADD